MVLKVEDLDIYQMAEELADIVWNIWGVIKSVRRLDFV